MSYYDIIKNKLGQFNIQFFGVDWMRSLLKYSCLAGA